MSATEQTSTQYKSSPEQSEPTFEQLLVEAHKDLDRLGPGSPNATLQALHFIEGLDEHSVLANLGCGTGGESLLLARYIPSTIIGLDMFEDFVSAFNQQAFNLNLSSRVKAVVGKMEELPFEPLSLDVIWSEGVLDAPGFKAGLLNWQNYLKRGGYFAVTSPSWLTSEHPTEVENSGAMQVAQLIPLKIISQPYAHVAIPISPRSYYLNIAGWITTISPAKTLYRNFQKNILKAKQ